MHSAEGIINDALQIGYRKKEIVANVRMRGDIL
jgi:hypothetical protein